MRSTFDRIIDGSRGVFVRFDKEYSYGDEHDAWKNFAKTVGDSSADILVADVGVSGTSQPATDGTSSSRLRLTGLSAHSHSSCAEYGDKDNSDISERYGIKSDDFPQYRLWNKGSASSADPTKFTGDKKSDAFLRFVQTEAGVWVGLPGQIKALDVIAKEFVKSSDKAAVVKQAEEAAKEEKDADSAKYYVKVMTKAAGDDAYLGKESARLQKMIDDGSVKAAKKEQFGRRLNVLSSFS